MVRGADRGHPRHISTASRAARSAYDALDRRTRPQGRWLEPPRDIDGPRNTLDGAEGSDGSTMSTSTPWAARSLTLAGSQTGPRSSDGRSPAGIGSQRR